MITASIYIYICSRSTIYTIYLYMGVCVVLIRTCFCGIANDQSGLRYCLSDLVNGQNEDLVGLVDRLPYDRQVVRTRIDRLFLVVLGNVQLTTTPPDQVVETRSILFLQRHQLEQQTTEQHKAEQPETIWTTSDRTTHSRPYRTTSSRTTYNRQNRTEQRTTGQRQVEQHTTGQHQVEQHTRGQFQTKQFNVSQMR